MQSIFFIVFRRMRAPLISLVVAYAVAVLGLALIPGQDGAGNPWRMDFFHALYVVSYTATTIGFGELPYEFTDAQRMWVLVAIYATVVVWIYSIGTLINLLQDPVFRQAVVETRFARRVRFMRESFYLVAGYGETGGALVEALTEHDRRAVVIDKDPERIRLLRMENLRNFVPGLCADAALPVHLIEAGLKHPQCQGVVAVTNVNEVNLYVAITSKLLKPSLRVVCRADARDIEANMASFGTDYIVDPFDTFAQHLSLALQTPCIHLLQEWITGVAHAKLPEPLFPPRKGLWVLCGYGRFGKAVYRRLQQQGLETVVIESDPKAMRAPAGSVVGRGTEAETLRQARIESAVGLVAGTNHDVDNLSIIMTARELNPNLFVILRQNLKANDPIAEAVRADMVMHPSSIIANRIRVLLATPLLAEFVAAAQYEEEPWAREIVSRVLGLVSDEVPHVWEVTVDREDAFAVAGVLRSGREVTVGNLLSDPRERDRKLGCIVLMLRRTEARILLPSEEEELREGDRLLFCGRYSAHPKMEWTLQNEHALAYVRTGSSAPKGWVWRFVERVAKRSKGSVQRVGG